MYYIVYVFQMAGLTGNVNLVSSSVQYVIFLVTTAITLLFIDRLGRRPLFIYGAVAMGALNFAVAGLMKTGGHSVTNVADNYNIKWQVEGSYATGVIACSYLFVAFYGLTWVCVFLNLRNYKRMKLLETNMLIQKNRLLVHGSSSLKSSHFSIVPRVLVSPLQPTGFLTLRLHTLSHLRLRTFNGALTSCLVYSASAVSRTVSSCSQRFVTQLHPSFSPSSDLT